jgi:hypothetical protein
MEYKTEYHPTDYDNDGLSLTESEQIKNQLDKLKQSDRGYNKIWRNKLKNGRLKRTKVEIYTSSGVGNHIRDAETGEYYPYVVGSADEDLFFSVILATGECKSSNGSSTLFYLSPEKYMQHLNHTIPEHIIERWNDKKDRRMRERKMEKGEKKQNLSSFVVVK